MAVIFHLDLDSFFVSAERLVRPELRGKCVAVGGDGPRGVIASCSYEARKYGVRSAMPSSQAKRLCPQLMIVHGNFDLYTRLSSQVFQLISEFTPTYEAVSIDEAYLDMTGCESLWGKPIEAAAKLKAKVKEVTGLTCSIGIAPNRLVAKVASDFNKPNGLYEVLPGAEPSFLAPMPVRALPGCGPATEKWLHSRGIFRVEELQRASLENLVSHYGRYGNYLHDSAWGRGSISFNEESKTRSMSREETFDRNIFDESVVKKVLWQMCSDLGASVRAAPEGEDYARAVRLKIRYAPFETVTRSRVLKSPARRDAEIYEAVEKLFLENWNSDKPLRLIGAGVVLGDGKYQLSLFDQPLHAEKLENLDQLKDEIKRKFGESIIKTGRDL